MKIVFRFAAVLLLAVLLCAGAVAVMPETVVAGGGVVALELKMPGVCVVDLASDAPRRAGLRCGDIICSVNGREISGSAALQRFVSQSDGAKLELCIRRSGEEKRIFLAPYATAEGWRLGVSVRERLAGIGTLTFYDPATQRFGALGHGVNDGKSGVLLPMQSGAIRTARVTGITRGEAGTPGALHGATLGEEPLGVLTQNSKRGSFGECAGFAGRCLPTARAAQVHTGEAQILSTVRGTEQREYGIVIESLDPGDALGRQMHIRVTDTALLAQTGGIVQGMSGSPIVQDGRLVGAVTHVLIDDPTRGYGIFFETMWNTLARQSELQNAA